MIDRIEELLAELAAEDDEEQQEDVLARKRGAVVSSGLSSERSESGEAPEGRTAFAESESLDRVANRRSVTTVETGAENAPAVEKLWKDGPVWTVHSVEPEIDEVQRAAMAERTAQAEGAIWPQWDGERIWAGPEWVAGGGSLGAALESVRRSGPGRTGPEQAGLKGLYRQTVRGLRPAAPALPPEQAGRTARAQEPGSAASLAVDELDRAVRRDSRRYDGGMSIY